MQRSWIGKMRSWTIRALALLAAVLAAAPARADCSAPNPDGRNRVPLATVLGVICLDLLDQPSEAPETVQNFLNYYERGDFENSFFHRLIPGFVLQGGGFRYTAADGYEAIPQDPPVANDPDPVNRSNVRGTVAMAKLAMQPDSATNQFFINLGNNAANLDNQNGGFTVFARVVAEDLAVVDQIAALHREYGPYAIDDPLRSQFANLPVLEVLERDPSGYGCLIVYPDPIQNQQGMTVPLGVNNCPDQASFNAAVQLTIAAMDPQVPERLVLVPEPASPLLLAAGGALLALAGRARSRRRRWLSPGSRAAPQPRPVWKGPGTSEGSMSPRRRQPTASSQVRGGLVGGGAAGGSRSSRGRQLQPSNQRADDAGSSRTDAFSALRFPSRPCAACRRALSST